MQDNSATDITSILVAISHDRAGAADQLMSLVMQELRVIAKSRLAHKPRDVTLHPTALVNEAFLRLFGKDTPSWENRRHFFWAASRAMHDVLVESARRHGAKKRGGGFVRVPLDDGAGCRDARAEELLAISEAIERLKEEDERVANVVLFRFFCGMDHEETARVLDVSTVTVRRDWAYAKAWLRQELGDPADESDIR